MPYGWKSEDAIGVDVAATVVASAATEIDATGKYPFCLVYCPDEAVRVRFGDGTTVVVAADKYVPCGQAMHVHKGKATHVSVLTFAGSHDVFFYSGQLGR